MYHSHGYQSAHYPPPAVQTHPALHHSASYNTPYAPPTYAQPHASQGPYDFTTLQHVAGRVAFGPFLRYLKYDPSTFRYDLSVLVVVSAEAMPPPGTPAQLMVTDAGAAAAAGVAAAPVPWPAEVLAVWDRFTFLRFRFAVNTTPFERAIQYQVVLGPAAAPATCAATRPYTFTVPASGQEWHWAFYSCNGFEDTVKEVEYRGVQPMWRHLMQRHRERPLHALVGGGDQLYNDHVWHGPLLSRWEVKDDTNHYDQGMVMPFDAHLQRECEEYYFSHYCLHFTQDVVQEALASIPSIMVWDDHDIFDGWGSYSYQVQNAPVMQGVYQVARFFYQLFQLHTTEALLPTDRIYWGSQGCAHQTCPLGPFTTLVTLDTRSARTQNQCFPAADLVTLRGVLMGLPQGVKHVVVTLTVPMIYPELPVHDTLHEVQHGKPSGPLGVVAHVLGKTGLAHPLKKSRFGMVEILDDVIDHWGNPHHTAERDALLTMLLEVAALRCIRVSLLSGDVHVAGYGQFYSRPRGRPDYPELPLERDPRFVPQIISSAIGNEPPPPALIKALQLAGLKSNKVLLDVQERMVPLFGDSSNHTSLLMGARNWCEVMSSPPPPGALHPDGALDFMLHCERTKGVGVDAMQTFTIRVPPLLPPH